MKDQVASLNQAGIHAAYLNSSLSASQYKKALSYASQGRYPIIYVAPERLLTEEFLQFALKVKISMVVVDEAHCVSQWRQDFRLSYLKIVDFIEKLPNRPVISAFTATATKEVRDDIIDILMLQDPSVVSTGYDRPNLYLSVQSPKDKYAALKNFVDKHQGQCGIIYCLTRKQVEELCNRLNKEGLSATRYHAGLSDVERRTGQERLKKITFYCFTNDCLRDYILRYFGEYKENYCGNCSICLSGFETVDVTDFAKTLIGCVKDSRQKYGITVILDTVHGANTVKIRNYRMNENPHYAVLSKIPAYKLRQVMNHHLLKEYLSMTNDEYAIIKLTEKANAVLTGEEIVMMKMAKEEIVSSNVKQTKKIKKDNHRLWIYRKQTKRCLRN